MKTSEKDRIIELGKQFIDDDEKFTEFKTRIEALYALGNPTAEEVADLFGELAAQLITKKLLRKEDQAILDALAPLTRITARNLVRKYVEDIMGGASVKKVTMR